MEASKDGFGLALGGASVVCDVSDDVEGGVASKVNATYLSAETKSKITAIKPPQYDSHVIMMSRRT